jgi:hypothetical protein
MERVAIAPHNRLGFGARMPMCGTWTTQDQLHPRWTGFILMKVGVYIIKALSDARMPEAEPSLWAPYD